MESEVDTLSLTDNEELYKIQDGSVDDSQPSPFSKSRYGRTRKPKISQDFYDIDVIFDTTKDVKRNPRVSQQMKSPTNARVLKPKLDEEDVRKENKAPFQHITADSEMEDNDTPFVHVTADSEVEDTIPLTPASNDDKIAALNSTITLPITNNTEVLNISKSEMEPTSILSNTNTVNQELTNELSEDTLNDISRLNVSEVLKIIRPLKQSGSDTDTMNLKSNMKPTLKTYANKRKCFIKPGIVESFGLPDKSILPASSDATSLNEPKRYKDLDVPSTSDMDINLVDKSLLNTPWKIASINTDMSTSETLLDPAYADAPENGLEDILEPVNDNSQLNVLPKSNSDENIPPKAHSLDDLQQEKVSESDKSKANIDVTENLYTNVNLIEPTHLISKSSDVAKIKGDKRHSDVSKSKTRHKHKSGSKHHHKDKTNIEAPKLQLDTDVSSESKKHRSSKNKHRHESKSSPEEKGTGSGIESKKMSTEKIRKSTEVLTNTRENKEVYEKLDVSLSKMKQNLTEQLSKNLPTVSTDKQVKITESNKKLEPLSSSKLAKTVAKGVETFSNKKKTKVPISSIKMFEEPLFSVPDAQIPRITIDKPKNESSVKIDSKEKLSIQASTKDKNDDLKIKSPQPQSDDCDLNKEQKIEMVNVKTKQEEIKDRSKKHDESTTKTKKKESENVKSQLKIKETSKNLSELKEKSKVDNQTKGTKKDHTKEVRKVHSKVKSMSSSSEHIDDSLLIIPKSKARIPDINKNDTSYIKDNKRTKTKSPVRHNKTRTEKPDDKSLKNKLEKNAISDDSKTIKSDRKGYKDKSIINKEDTFQESDISNINILKPQAKVESIKTDLKTSDIEKQLDRIHGIESTVEEYATPTITKIDTSEDNETVNIRRKASKFEEETQEKSTPTLGKNEKARGKKQIIASTSKPLQADMKPSVTRSGRKGKINKAISQFNEVQESTSTPSEINHEPMGNNEMDKETEQFVIVNESEDNSIINDEKVENTSELEHEKRQDFCILLDKFEEISSNLSKLVEAKKFATSPVVSKPAWPTKAQRKAVVSLTPEKKKYSDKQLKVVLENQDFSITKTKGRSRTRSLVSSASLPTSLWEEPQTSLNRTHSLENIALSENNKQEEIKSEQTRRLSKRLTKNTPEIIPTDLNVKQTIRSGTKPTKLKLENVSGKIPLVSTRSSKTPTLNAVEKQVSESDKTDNKLTVTPTTGKKRISSKQENEVTVLQKRTRSSAANDKRTPNVQTLEVPKENLKKSTLLQNTDIPTDKYRRSSRNTHGDKSKSNDQINTITDKKHNRELLVSPSMTEDKTPAKKSHERLSKQDSVKNNIFRKSIIESSDNTVRVLRSSSSLDVQDVSSNGRLRRRRALSLCCMSKKDENHIKSTTSKSEKGIAVDSLLKRTKLNSQENISKDKHTKQNSHSGSSDSIPLVSGRKAITPRTRSASSLSYSSKGSRGSSIDRAVDAISAIKKRTDSVKALVKKKPSTKNLDLQHRIAPTNVQAGELMWVRIGSYPYWPCLVMNEPESNIFQKTLAFKTKSKLWYHVRFYGDKGRRCWSSVEHIMQFESENDLQEMYNWHKAQLGSKANLQSYIIKPYLKPQWEKAVAEAVSMKRKTVTDRLHFFLSMLEPNVNIKKKSLPLIPTEADVKNTKISKLNTNREPSPARSVTLDSRLIRSKSLPPLSTRSSKNSFVESDRKKKIENENRKMGNDKKRIENDTKKIEIDKKKKIEEDKTKVENEKKKIENDIKEIENDKKKKENQTKHDKIQIESNKTQIESNKKQIENNKQQIENNKKLIEHKTIAEIKKGHYSPLPKFAQVNDKENLTELLPKESPNSLIKDTFSNITLEKKDVDKFPSEVNSECSLSDSDTFSKCSMSTVLETSNFPELIVRQKRNNLFRGVSKHRVCQICTRLREVLKCQGPCNGLYHEQCAKDLVVQQNLELQKENVCADTSIISHEIPTEQDAILADPEVIDNVKSSNTVSSTDEKILNDANDKVNCDAFEPEDILPAPKSVSYSIAEQIDMKMKEVMSLQDSYADSTTDYTSSDETLTNSVFPPETNSKERQTTAEQVNHSSSKIVNTVVAVAKNLPLKAVDSVNTVEHGSISKHNSAELVASTNTALDLFKCQYCRADMAPPCFICGMEVSAKNVGVRQKCSLNQCGRFYHPHCLKLWPQTQWSIISTVKHKDSETDLDTFVCPVHVCHTCSSDNPHMPLSRCRSNRVVKCLRCPATYHSTNYCVPAGTDILTTSQIICPRHFEKQGKKNKSSRTINTTWCFICSKGGDLVCCETCPTSIHPECLHVNLMEDGTFVCEDCETGRFPLYDEIVWVKLGTYRWWPATILFPSEVPENIKNLRHNKGEFVVKFFGTHDHYWVHRGRVFLFQEGDRAHSSPVKTKVDISFKKSVEEAARAHQSKNAFAQSMKAEMQTENKPPPYIKIKSNKPVGNVRMFDPNVSNPTPCECMPSHSNPCGPESDCLNRILSTECDPNICPAKDKCNNQVFEKRQYPPLVPYKTETRGWGLKTVAPIKKGEFIIEYVGELIDEQEYQRRIYKMHEQKDENYYFLTIDKDRIIDAGPKGNLARFMNHCCQPNSETQKWTVNGDTRVGLFALVNIPAETEITFNYQLQCIGKEKKICVCGAPNCNGFIGGKTKLDESQKRVKNNGIKRKRGYSTPPAVSIIDGPCFVCGKSGDVGACQNKICTKFYHLKCLNLKFWPEGKWSCPCHNCNVCNKRTIRCCVKCINSYCPVHSEGNVHYHNLLGFVCSEHDPTKESQELVSESNSCAKPTSSSAKMYTAETDVTSTTADENEQIETSKTIDKVANLETPPTLYKKKNYTDFVRTLEAFEDGFTAADFKNNSTENEVLEQISKRKRGSQKRSAGNLPKKIKLSNEVTKPAPTYPSPSILDIPAQNEVKLSSTVPARHLRTTRKVSSTESEIKQLIKRQSEYEKDLPIRKRTRPRCEVNL